MTSASPPSRSWVLARLLSGWFVLPTRCRLRLAVCGVERT